jgi:hypothetical protein
VLLSKCLQKSDMFNKTAENVDYFNDADLTKFFRCFRIELFQCLIGVVDYVNAKSHSIR